MARGAAKQRTASPKPDARRRASGRSGGAGVEQTLFFNRLRRQAKWVFVLLVLVFGAGAVVFGVGSGSSGFGGLGDLINGKGSKSSSGPPSVEEAFKQVQKHPNSPAANRAYATALITAQRETEAIQPLEQYLSKRPKDVQALTDLAGAYQANLQAIGQEVDAAQQALDSAPSGTFGLDSTSVLGQAIGQDPIAAREQAQAAARYDSAVGAAFQTFQREIDAYRRVADLRPTEPSAQLQLAQAAGGAINFPTPRDQTLAASQIAQERADATMAIAAYRRMAKLYVGDASTTSSINKQIKLLQTALRAGPSR